MTTVKYIGAVDAQVEYGGGDDPRGLLIEGQEYEVDRLSIGDFYTDVYLKDHPDKRFNSVCFEGVELP